MQAQSESQPQGQGPQPQAVAWFMSVCLWRLELHCMAHDIKMYNLWQMPAERFATVVHATFIFVQLDSKLLFISHDPQVGILIQWSAHNSHKAYFRKGFIGIGHVQNVQYKSFDIMKLLRQIRWVLSAVSRATIIWAPFILLRWKVAPSQSSFVPRRQFHFNSPLRIHCSVLVLGHLRSSRR